MAQLCTFESVSAGVGSSLGESADACVNNEGVVASARVPERLAVTPRARLGNDPSVVKRVVRTHGPSRTLALPRSPSQWGTRRLWLLLSADWV